ncbi:protein of unknown function [Shewanella benthica]|uniref:Uncharacterized protein n=1 Tax=Shewanella benthica TaxID=43661 RepID=A0A330M1L6_9GAMM|nr:protein of unknown function [Shewanella benthica]
MKDRDSELAKEVDLLADDCMDAGGRTKQDARVEGIADSL